MYKTHLNFIDSVGSGTTSCTRAREEVQMPPLLVRRHQDRLAGQPRPLRPHEGAEALPLHLQRPLPLLRHVQRLHRQPRQQGPPQGQAFQGKVFSLLSLGDLLFFFLVPICQLCFQSILT